VTDRPAGLAPGLWGILATPFAGPEHDVDEASLRREVALFRELPATGLVALGVFGYRWWPGCRPGTPRRPWSRPPPRRPPAAGSPG